MSQEKLCQTCGNPIIGKVHEVKLNNKGGVMLFHETPKDCMEAEHKRREKHVKDVEEPVVTSNP